MLPRDRRIRRAPDFRAVTGSGRRCATRTLVVHVGPLAQRPPADVPAGPARAGFVVGRAVGGSVVRARVIRRLRHLVAPLLPAIPDGTGVVVRALPASASASWDDLDRDLRSALRRCRALGQGARTGPGVAP